MSRVLISSGSPFEPIVGFSRAMRVGNSISVAGTTGASSSKPVAIGDAAAQARATLETISEAFGKAGASLNDVVRTRVYVTGIADFEAVGRVHGEFFGEVRPANTTLQIAGLPDPDWLVEIEADTVIVGTAE